MTFLEVHDSSLSLLYYLMYQENVCHLHYATYLKLYSNSDSGMCSYPCFPKRDTVVPPTGMAFLGPYTSQMVKQTWAWRGRSGYFMGNLSHSFQLQKNQITWKINLDWYCMQVNITDLYTCRTNSYSSCTSPSSYFMHFS